MTTPSVHVLVINWNGLEHLQACFDSLLAGTYPNARYVLVDNGSTDDSVAFTRARYGERVEILALGRNLGWSGGNNAGMARALEAGADYVFLLNNDTATAPDALDRLVAMAEARPETGALAPKMVLFHAPEIINSVGLECSIIGSSWDKGVGRLDAPRWNVSERVIGVCGGAFFLRASALRKTGLLPEDFEIYLDDLDLSLRLWDAGYEIWSCPEAVVRHKFSATLGQGRRARWKYYLNTRNRFRVILRNFPVRTWPGIEVPVLIGECRALGRALLDGEAWRVWAHVRAWGSGLLYHRQAWLERRRRRDRGLTPGRFWPLLRRDILFCPGALLPEQGWYPSRVFRGESLRPMGRRAWMEAPPGRLRLLHANCYPALGVTEVTVRMNGVDVTTLSTRDLEAVDLDTAGGRLELEARNVFEAEATGEVVDLGGWIRVDSKAR